MGEYALEVAEKVALLSKMKAELQLATVLHDSGMVRVSYEIPNKRGKLPD